MPRFLTRDEYEIRLTPKLFQELVWFAKAFVGDLAEDAVQEALRYFWQYKRESFDLSGRAKLESYLKACIRWRALNIKKAYGRWVPLDTQTDNEPWVKPWDDYEHDQAYLAIDPDTANDESTEMSESVDDEARCAAWDWEVYWNAHPREYEKLMQDIPECEEEAPVFDPPTEDEMSTRCGDSDEWLDDKERKKTQADVVKRMTPDRRKRPRPPGAGFNFCDYVHVHKYGDPLVGISPCLLCGGDDPPIEVARRARDAPVIDGCVRNTQLMRREYEKRQIVVRDYFGNYIRTMEGSEPADGVTRSFDTWEDRAMCVSYTYTEDQVWRWNPSLDPTCPEARRFIRAFGDMVGIPHARHIYGYTRPDFLEAPDRTLWVGDDYGVHLALSQLSPGDFALVWLLDSQGYEQVEINNADSIDDAYARALAQPFKGTRQYKISRRHTSIEERLAALYQLARLFPLTPAIAERIVQRAALRIRVYEVPADDTCCYCGGLMIQTWVDERWRRLLDDVPGVDPAYLAKRCANCGDLIDCLTLKRRPKDYRQSEEVPDGFRKLARQYTLVWEALGPVSFGLPVKDRGGSNRPR